MKKKRSNRSRRAGQKPSTPMPAWLWLVLGMLLGLVAATIFFFKGYLPQAEEPTNAINDAKPAVMEDKPIIEAASDNTPAAKPTYDFFTVLPEMEVVVPAEQISRSPTTVNQTPQNYFLQVGSFQSAADADQMKARLALLGMQAKIQSVTVNGSLWHRVRVGPYQSTRKVEGLHQQLQANSLEAIILREPRP